jgi:hypothetical protein
MNGRFGTLFGRIHVFLKKWRAVPDCSVNESNMLSESMLGGCGKRISLTILSIAEASNGAYKNSK